MAKAKPPQPVGDDPFVHAHSPEAERAVLGVVLDGRHPGAWWTVREHCAGPAAFWNQTHRLIALMVDRLANTGGKIDAITVTEAARQTRWADAIDALKALDGDANAIAPASPTAAYEDSLLIGIGGHDAILSIASAYAPATGLAGNAAVLAACHRQRRLIADLAESLRKAKAPDGIKRSSVIVEETINRLSTTVGNGQGSDSVGAAADRLLIAHDEAARSGDQVTCSWGIDALDKACRLVPTMLTVVAARPGCGKTSMLLQAATATYDKHGPGRVALVTLEMSSDDITSIIIGRQLRIGRHRIERGWLSAEERAAMVARRDEWHANDIPIKGSGGNTAAEICGWARALKRRTGGRLMFLGVDYVQLVTGTNAKQNENDRISEITRSLKVLARDEGIVVMLLSQMSREGTKEKRRPRLSDLRGSGSIEQDADAVVFLHGDPDEKPAVMPVSAIIAKNRRGDETTHGLEFMRANFQTFREYGATDNPIPRWTRMAAPASSSEDVADREQQET